MQTCHKLLFGDSRKMAEMADNSVDLIVTSPPYPMIEMWDRLFSELNPEIRAALHRNCGRDAFELMNLELDKVWYELDRIVRPGGFACINIGDATRTIGKNFALYSNHSRITETFTKLQFIALPLILWRKATNAPNKFMGSGMLPAGAYITLEHEYILIFRKGGKRVFISDEEKRTRRVSAIFWEERNKWFSDLWDLKGVRQELDGQELRDRSAAYPFELPYRLINMYSVRGDTVFDPFLGTGTTMFAAIASGRNSYGLEYDISFKDLATGNIAQIKKLANMRTAERVVHHLQFINDSMIGGKNLKYQNRNHGFLVMTKQETEMEIQNVKTVTEVDDGSLLAEHVSIGTAVGPHDYHEMLNRTLHTIDNGQGSLFD